MLGRRLEAPAARCLDLPPRFTSALTLPPSSRATSHPPGLAGHHDPSMPPLRCRATAAWCWSRGTATSTACGRDCGATGPPTRSCGRRVSHSYSPSTRRCPCGERTVTTGRATSAPTRATPRCRRRGEGRGKQKTNKSRRPVCVGRLGGQFRRRQPGAHARDGGGNAACGAQVAHVCLPFSGAARGMPAELPAPHPPLLSHRAADFRGQVLSCAGASRCSVSREITRSGCLTWQTRRRNTPCTTHPMLHSLRPLPMQAAVVKPAPALWDICACKGCSSSWHEAC